MTLPGIRKGVGRRHPLMQTMEAVKTVLQGMGFRYDDYPEVETEYHNFDSLNTPQVAPLARHARLVLHQGRRCVAHPHDGVSGAGDAAPKEPADPRDDFRAAVIAATRSTRPTSRSSTSWT